MTVQVNVLEDGVGVEILATGVVTGHEIIEAHDLIYDSSHLRKQKYHIIDKTKCTEHDVTAAEIKSIANLDKQASEINPNIVIAVIESGRLQFTLTELWEAQVRGSVFKTKSFTDRQSALEWITQNVKPA